MSYRRRTFPEVLDRLLVATVGGISAEEHPFPPAAAAPYTHALVYAPAAQLISLYGTHNGQSHLFRLDKDYALSSDKQSVVWSKDGDWPDAGTVISVNYLPKDSQAKLNDLYVGSVTRTLAESIGLELARLYAQLQLVYESGFIDTSEGKALESLVSLLGIKRIKGGFPAGELELRRAANSSGAITIPSGIRVLNESGDVEYETTADVTMAPQQERIRVAIRDLERNDPMDANTLTVLAIPIAGIATVTNPSATAISLDEETDEQIRSRAKNFLHGNERATLGAIKQAIARQQINADVVETSQPGVIEYTLHGDSISPELEQRVKTAIEEARPAGVLVIPKPNVLPLKLNIKLLLKTSKGALEADLNNAHQKVKSAIEAYLKDLPLADNGSINKLVGQILAVPLIEDLTIENIAAEGSADSIWDSEKGILALANKAAVLGELQLTDPNLPTLISVVLQHPASADVPDKTAITQALNGMLNYLNNINSKPVADATIVSLSLGKLLFALPLPLPNHTATPLDQYLSSSELPQLADIAPYRVTYTFAQNTGLTRLIKEDASSYDLQPYEQLVLSALIIQVE